MWRVTPDKKGYVTGTKGKLWKPISEYSGIEDVDMDYYEGLVDKAIAAIDEVGSIHELIDPFEPVGVMVPPDSVVIDGVLVTPADLPF